MRARWRSVRSANRSGQRRYVRCPHSRWSSGTTRVFRRHLPRPLAAGRRNLAMAGATAMWNQAESECYGFMYFVGCPNASVLKCNKPAIHKSTRHLLRRLFNIGFEWNDVDRSLWSMFYVILELYHLYIGIVSSFVP